MCGLQELSAIAQASQEAQFVSGLGARSGQHVHSPDCDKDRHEHGLADEVREYESALEVRLISGGFQGRVSVTQNRNDFKNHYEIG